LLLEILELYSLVLLLFIFLPVTTRFAELIKLKFGTPIAGPIANAL